MRVGLQIDDGGFMVVSVVVVGWETIFGWILLPQPLPLPLIFDQQMLSGYRDDLPLRLCR